jgi:hypothetical protein
MPCAFFSQKQQGRPDSKMVKKLFSQPPPLELVTDTLRACGVSLHDLRWFSRDELNLSTQEEWLPLLSPYYIPCKARRFLEDKGRLTPADVITIFRHILEPHGYGLGAEERLYRDKKQTIYQVRPVRSRLDLSGDSILVEFL